MEMAQENSNTWVGWGSADKSPELVTFDPGQRRISIFSLNLEHLCTFELEYESSSWLRWVQCAGSGSLIGAYSERTANF